MVPICGSRKWLPVKEQSVHSKREKEICLNKWDQCINGISNVGTHSKLFMSYYYDQSPELHISKQLARTFKETHFDLPFMDPTFHQLRISFEIILSVRVRIDHPRAGASPFLREDRLRRWILRICAFAR